MFSRIVKFKQKGPSVALYEAQNRLSLARVSNITSSCNRVGILVRTLPARFTLVTDDALGLTRPTRTGNSLPYNRSYDGRVIEFHVDLQCRLYVWPLDRPAPLQSHFFSISCGCCFHSSKIQLYIVDAIAKDNVADGLLNFVPNGITRGKKYHFGALCQRNKKKKDV